MENKYLDILLAERDSLLISIENSKRRVFCMTIIILIFSGIILGVDLSSQIIDIYLLTFVPISLVILVGIIYNIFTDWIVQELHLQLIMTRIAEQTMVSGIELYHHKASIAHGFQSFENKGAHKSLGFFVMSMIGILIIYINLVFLIRIYENTHLLGILLGIILVFFIYMLVSASISVLNELPKSYEYLIKNNQDNSINHKSHEFVNKKSQIILFPRMIDFFSKSWLFISGVFAAILFNGFNYINPRIYDLFTDKTLGSAVPKWMILAFSFVWYIVQEFFVQQSKYLWNDLRDRDRDIQTGGKDDRVVISNNYKPKKIAGLIVFRFAFGVLLGMILDIRLGIIAIIIILTQILYEFVIKTKADKIPLLATIFIAVGSLIRFLSGALSITDRLNYPIIVLSTFFFYLGIGYIAKYWRIEAEHVKKFSRKYPPRLQSDFFLKNGSGWQHFGFTGMFISSVLLLLLGLSKFDVATHISIMGKSFLNCDNPIPCFNIFLLLVTIIFVSILTLSLYKFFTRLVLFFSSHTILGKLAPIIFGGFFLFCIFFVPNSRNIEVIAGFLFIVFSIGALITYEGMSYEQFLLNPLKHNLKTIGNLWFTYLFYAESKITFKQLIKFSSLLLKKSEEELLALDSEYRAFQILNMKNFR